MTDFRFFGEVTQRLEPHPLLPYGYDFDSASEVIITEWGDALPPSDFSEEQYELLHSVADKPRLTDTEAVVLLAGYLRPKLVYGTEFGCWELPLTAPYDSKNRARYPLITITKIGYDKQLAHRASVETFMGVPLPRNEARNKYVDHRCRNHACCNPYHLEVVSADVNTRRGVSAKRRLIAPDLFQIAAGTRLFSELADG